MMDIQKVTQQNFDEIVLGSSKPVIVGFSAPWCGYCRRLKPAMGQLAAELADRVSLMSVNIDEEPELAARCGVETIPSLMLCRDGKTSELLVNPPSKAAVKTWLEGKGI